MSLWLKTVGAQRKDILALPESRIRLVMAACIHRAFIYRQSTFSRDLGEPTVKIVEDALKALCEAALSGGNSLAIEKVVHSVESLVPKEDANEMMISGWEYFLDALVYALQCYTGDDAHSHVIAVLNYAYLAICDEVVSSYMSQSDQSLLGDESTEIERASPVCQREIEFQLRCLDAAEKGDYVDPFDVYS